MDILSVGTGGASKAPSVALENKAPTPKSMKVRNAANFKGGNTLAQAFALRQTGGHATGSTLVSATAANPKALPLDPFGVVSTFSSILSDVTKGMSRLLGQEESPAKKHSRLYNPIAPPKNATAPYKPALADFFRFDSAAVADLATLFGNNNSAKKADRNLRAGIRANIEQGTGQRLARSGYVNRARLSGFDYIRSRKSKPNVPLGTQGTSVLVMRDVRMKGRFGALDTVPRSVQERLRSIPVGSQRMLPNQTVAPAKPPVTYAPELMKDVNVPGILTTAPTAQPSLSYSSPKAEVA